MTRSVLKEAIQLVHTASPVSEGEEFERSLELLGAAKTDLLPLEGVSITVNGESVPFSRVFFRYLEIQEERGIMNYDDMIYFAVRILLADDAMRRRYQECFTYILVDEFQDLNRAQILLLEILALPENNLFIVGDDDQLIYGWRGANVRSIIDFPRLHACARETILSTNYRSSARIIAHAGWLISRNRERVPKSVVPRAGAPPGEFDVILRPGLWEQAQSAVEWIVRNRGAARWRDTAVLSRYNAHQFIMALALDRKSIPHTVVDGSRLFDSRAGKDVAAWFNVILFPLSVGRGDLERILSRPERLLRRSLIESLESWHDLELLPGTGVLTAGEEESLQLLFSRVLSLRLRVPLVSASGLLGDIDRVMRLRMSYDRRRKAASNPDEADEGTYLDVIGAVSRTFPTPESFFAHITESLRTRAAPPAPSDSPPERDEVVLSTIHRAKGNEFSRVVFFDLSRRHRPGAGETEEERRVAYVGLTRAKDSLLVTANGRRQSPFLREAALDPQFAGRMREDMQSELSELLKKIRRLSSANGTAASRKMTSLVQVVSSLQEELRCRSMLSLPP